MKNWYLIDDATAARGEIFDKTLPCSSQEEAYDLAVREWKALSDADRASRDEFYIGFAEADEEGCVNYNSMTDIISIKKDEPTSRIILRDRYVTIETALRYVLFDVVLAKMDRETRERVEKIPGPKSIFLFLHEYLKLAPGDLHL